MPAGCSGGGTDTGDTNGNGRDGELFFSGLGAFLGYRLLPGAAHRGFSDVFQGGGWVYSVFRKRSYISLEKALFYRILRDFQFIRQFFDGPDSYAIDFHFYNFRNFSKKNKFFEFSLDISLTAG
jgi:hypothetical protein